MDPAASLLPSGLYRRPRSLTGSCATGACGLYRRSGVGPFGPHPAPKAWISVHQLYITHRRATPRPLRSGRTVLCLRLPSLSQCYSVERLPSPAVARAAASRSGCGARLTRRRNGSPLPGPPMSVFVGYGFMGWVGEVKPARMAALRGLKLNSPILRCPGPLLRIRDPHDFGRPKS